MGKQELALRITGRNSDGEYWLHIDGAPQSAGFNLGDPNGMIASALLMAASGHTYTRLDPNTRTASIPNAAYVAGMEAALRFYADFYENPNDGPWGVQSTDYGKHARAALSARPDAPNSRVVTVDMQRGWLDGFNSALDTVKSITVSVGVVSQANIISILQSLFDSQLSSVSDEIRAIIGEVK